jgi:hypothetical protein
MRTAFFCACALALLGVVPVSAADDLSSSIVGLWSINSFVRKDVASGVEEKPYGEYPQGRILYTKGGNILWFGVAENRPKPSGPAPSDAERVELFRSMFAFTGRYKVEGSSISGPTDVAWVPGWTANVANVKMTGNTIAITSSTFKSPVTGKDVVTITTAERLE